MVFAPLMSKPDKDDYALEMKANKNAAILWIFILDNVDMIQKELPPTASNFCIVERPEPLSASVIDKLCVKGSTIAFETGDTIMDFNHRIQHVYIIQKGSVELQYDKFKFQSLGPGSLLDQSLFLRGCVFTRSLWNYIASSACQIITVDLRILNTILASGLLNIIYI